MARFDPDFVRDNQRAKKQDDTRLKETGKGAITIPKTDQSRYNYNDYETSINEVYYDHRIDKLNVAEIPEMYKIDYSDESQKEKVRGSLKELRFPEGMNKLIAGVTGHSERMEAIKSANLKPHIEDLIQRINKGYYSSKDISLYANPRVISFRLDWGDWQDKLSFQVIDLKEYDEEEVKKNIQILKWAGRGERWFLAFSYGILHMAYKTNSDLAVLEFYYKE